MYDISTTLAPAKQVKEFRRVLKRRYRRFEQLTAGYTLWDRFITAFKIITKKSLI